MNSPFHLDTAEFEFLVSPLSTTGTRKPPTEPPTSSIRVRIGAVSHPGKVRPRNEDHYMVARVRRTLNILSHNLPTEEMPDAVGEDAYAMVVADGMGGMNAGDIASMLAISTGVKLADKSVKWGFKINEKEARDLLNRMSAYFQEIDRRITQKSDTDRRLFGMGTTLTLVYSVGVHLFLIHVGDSRAYLFRRGHLEQLTRDHTVAQALADAGQIKQEDVRKHSKRNTLTKYLGGHQGKIKADIRWLRLEDGDRVLVCSDGLTDMVEDPAIASCLTRHAESDQAALHLQQLALDHGGRDNITVLVASFSVPGPGSSAPSQVETADQVEPPLLDSTAEFRTGTDEFPVWQSPS
jgi:serine/threonine protein phosphatase PrpC